MYIVNTSFIVDSSEDGRWRDLLTNKYIPYLKSQGFGDVIFTKVLTNESPESFTYSLQVKVEDIPGYQRLTGEIFGEYLSIAGGLFGEKVLYFTSLLKHIDY